MSHKRYPVSKADVDLFRKAINNIKPTPKERRKITASLSSQQILTGADSWLTYLAAEDWLDSEDPLHFAKTGVQHKTIQRLKRGQWTLEAICDLHRQTLNEA